MKSFGTNRRGRIQGVQKFFVGHPYMGRIARSYLG